MSFKNETVLQTSCIYIKPEYMIMSMGFNKTVCYNLSFSFVLKVCAVMIMMNHFSARPI